MNDNQKRVFRYIRKSGREAKRIAEATYRLIREEWLGQVSSPKPRVLQFPVNDICNSHCVMCNIWKRKRGKEISPEELLKILDDPLFSTIQYVGLNGGEPTLRPDLADIGQALVQKMPRLKGCSIITNALNPHQATERIFELAKVFKTAGISFDVSVSLDGIGEIHDLNRGRKGNFVSAVEVIQSLKKSGIPVSIGCTLTDLNCYAADDVLSWCEQNNINWEFRVAVDIARIYNDGYSQQHPLSPEQRFHLAMFFDKLAHHPDANPVRQATYKSLSGQLALGKPRQIGCDYRAKGVTLDAKGDLSYCSVKSPILGSALANSAWDLFRTNLHLRRKILKDHCDSCQHFANPPRPGLSIRQSLEEIVEPWKKINQAGPSMQRSITRINDGDKNIPSQWKRVLITGWYGTETAGDKAILGELVSFLGNHAPESEIVLTTLDHKVTRQTILELPALKNISVVDMSKGDNPALIESVDAVIIGGGPIMQTRALEYIRRMFVEANRQRKARIIFGCGVGPLHSTQMQQTAASILQMATSGFFRDQESREYAIRLGSDTILDYACDPALAYLRRWTNSHPHPAQEVTTTRIVGLLRANTAEIDPELTVEQLDELTRESARNIAKIAEPFCRTYQAQLDLLPMNSIWVGGDDRLFNRKVAGSFNDPDLVRVERQYLTLEALLQLIYPAKMAVAMRYHGHLFCMSMGIPFLSIDYTKEFGKVKNLMRRIGFTQWSEEWENLNTTRGAKTLHQVYDQHEYWSEYLLKQTDILVAELDQCYRKVFHT